MASRSGSSAPRTRGRRCRCAWASAGGRPSGLHWSLVGCQEPGTSCVGFWGRFAAPAQGAQRGVPRPTAPCPLAPAAQPPPPRPSPPAAAARRAVPTRTLGLWRLRLWLRAGGGVHRASEMLHQRRVPARTGSNLLKWPQVTLEVRAAPSAPTHSACPDPTRSAPTRSARPDPLRPPRPTTWTRVDHAQQPHRSPRELGPRSISHQRPLQSSSRSGSSPGERTVPGVPWMDDGWSRGSRGGSRGFRGRVTP